ncbi:SIR2 family NAD-dependent protein deacylase [Flavobacterium dankookense]|uniref:SIR2-like protein n=1 Tax=Flavobacterium dankookense TaxID=706186 RepID=A0A4R6QA70_9FLAO|nr:SIR2 family protein [Flavobacterium dankookense]TDP59518.1 SIR2-like protein [Flavobacterium dankookense]
MSKESLFNHVRNEDVVIWAGAGLSLYAGYPSGEQLKNILIDNLTANEISEINTSQNLPELAEDIYRIKNHNRNFLINVLKKTFLNHIPISTKVHDNISNIPHFKTIITTNYDELFEKAYKNRSEVIYSSMNIPYVSKDKTNLFKVHGSFIEPNSLIITKSDYNNFFKASRDNEVFWTVIKERVSTKCVLFLGYNLEDPNTSVIFDKISDELKENRKEYYFIAPNIPPLKEKDLNHKGINYINSTAEDFIDELILNIKENIVSDLELGRTSADTFNTFLNNFSLKSELLAQNNKFKLKSINGLDGKVEGIIDLKFKDDEEYIKRFREIVNGKSIGEIELSREKLEKLEFRVSGIKLTEINDNNMFVIKTAPKKILKIDVKFVDGFEINDLETKIFSTTDFVELQLEYKNSIIKIKIETTKGSIINYNLSFEYFKDFTRVKDGIDLYTLQENIGLSKQFTVFTDKPGEKFRKSFPEFPELVNQAKNYKKYFEDLRMIEDFFNIRFINFSFASIGNDNFNIVEKIISVINGEILHYDFDGELSSEYEFDNAEESIKYFKDINDLNPTVEFNIDENEIVELHNQKISLGYRKIQIIESYIYNFEELLERKNRKVIFKSKCDKMTMFYHNCEEFKLIQ